MFRSVLTLKTSPETTRQLIDYYAEHEVMAEGMRRAGGLECELCISEEHPGELLVIGLWKSREDYRHWLDHPVRAELTAPIADLLPRAEGSLYRIEDRVTRASLGLE